MSYTVVPSAPKHRPVTVAAASVLLFIVAAAQLATIGVSLATLGPMQDVYADAYAGTDVGDVVVTSVKVAIFVSVAIYVLLAVAYVVLGIFVARGNNPARIVTWVVTGLAVLCSVCGLVGGATGGALSGLGANSAQTDLPDPQQLTDELNAALPGWLPAVSTTLSVLTLLMLIAIILLLALPGSNGYFRREAEVWVPPTDTWPNHGV